MLPLVLVTADLAFIAKLGSVSGTQLQARGGVSAQCCEWMLANGRKFSTDEFERMALGALTAQKLVAERRSRE